jgi:hypothetical protein
MLRVRELRFVTAVLVVGIGGFAVTRGLSVLRFSIAQSLAAAADTEVLDRFTAIPGVAALAQRSALELDDRQSQPPDLPAKINRLSGLLALTPLDSRDWLSLAWLRLRIGAPMDKSLPALALSSLAGPNEGYVMVPRGFLGLSMWQVMPKEGRRNAVGDLLGAWSMLVTPERERLRSTLDALNPVSRQEIRAAFLLADRNLGSQIADALGLAETPPATQ